MKIHTTARITILFAAAALALAGCSAPAASDTTGSATAAEAFSITDGWVKSAEDGMSAAFGELVNEGDADINVVAVTSEVSPMLELHETVEDESGQIVMQKKEGGFVIPAGGSFALEPGGNHIMIMDIAKALKAGDEVTFTLEFSDGSSASFTAPVKDYSGANETYKSDMDMGN